MTVLSQCPICGKWLETICGMQKKHRCLTEKLDEIIMLLRQRNLGID